MYTATAFCPSKDLISLPGPPKAPHVNRSYSSNGRCVLTGELDTQRSHLERTKVCFGSTILKPVCADLILCAQTFGTQLNRGRAHELAASALGFWTYKHLTLYQTPLTVRNYSHDPKNSEPEYLFLLAERIQKLFPHLRPSAAAMAVKIRETVVAHGLTVSLGKVTSKPDTHKYHAEILAALNDKRLPGPIRASAAIGRKIIPPPSLSYDTVLTRMGDTVNLYPAVRNFVWMDVRTLDKDFSLAHEDSYSYSGKTHRATIGLGISLISFETRMRRSLGTDITHAETYAFINIPRLEYHHNGGWHLSAFIRSSFRVGHPTNLGKALGERGIPESELRPIEQCPECRSIYVVGTGKPAPACQLRVQLPILAQAVNVLSASASNRYTQRSHA